MSLPSDVADQVWTNQHKQCEKRSLCNPEGLTKGKDFAALEGYETVASVDGHDQRGTETVEFVWRFQFSFL